MGAAAAFVGTHVGIHHRLVRPAGHGFLVLSDREKMATAPPPEGTDSRTSNSRAVVEEPQKANATMEIDEEADEADSSDADDSVHGDGNFFFASRSIDLSPTSTSEIVLGEMVAEPAMNSILSFLRAPARPVQQEA